MTETTEALKQTGDARDAQIAELKNQLQQRDAQIASLHKHIAEIEHRLAERERGLSRRSAMLSEDMHVRQIEGEPKRRWFSNSEFDLIVWLDSQKSRAVRNSSFMARAKRQDSRIAQKIRSLYGAKSPEEQEGQEEQQDRIIGFQLCYDKTGAERALTWQEATGYSHYHVDTGEEGSRSKRTPLLVADSNFKPMKIAELFRQRSAQIDRQIAQFVYEKIIQYQSSTEPDEPV